MPSAPHVDRERPDPRWYSDDVSELEKGVRRAARANEQATYHSLLTVNQAISAEERSRDLLEELMRSMDKGKSSD